MVPGYPDAILCSDGSDFWIWYIDNGKEGDPPNYHQTSFSVETDYDTIISGTPYSCSSYQEFTFALEATSTPTSTPTLQISTDPVMSVLLAGVLLVLSAMYVRRVFFS